MSISKHNPEEKQSFAQIVGDIVKRIRAFAGESSNGNLGMKITAAVITLLLWIVVVTQQNVVVTRSFDDIEVTLKGVEQLEECGIVLASENDYLVTVKLTGGVGVFDSFSEESLSAVVDVSGITEPGDHKLAVSVSGYGKNLSISGDVSLELTFDKLVSKNMPVTIITSGELEDGLVLGDVSVTPAAGITIEGALSDLENITSARATVDLEALGESDVLSLPIQLTDVNGGAIDMDAFTLSTYFCTVTLTVYETKSVSVEAEGSINARAAAGYEITGYSILPETVELCGEKNILAMLNSVKVTSAEVSDLSKDTAIETTIDLPEGIYYANGLLDEISIQIVIEVTAQEKLSIEIGSSDIEVTGLKEGLEAEITDGSVISMYIASDCDTTITARLLALQLDLSEIEEPGTYKVSMTCELPEGVTLAEPLPVTEVTVKEPEEEEEENVKSTRK